jgi:hypothetical protein
MSRAALQARHARRVIKSVRAWVDAGGVEVTECQPTRKEAQGPASPGQTLRGPARQYDRRVEPAERSFPVKPCGEAGREETYVKRIGPIV